MAIVHNDDGVVGKVCNKCGEWKPVNEFHRSSRAHDGHKADCKTCRNTANRLRDALGREQKCENIKPKQTITGKVCVGCKEWKLVSEFSPLSWKGKPLGNGYRSRCKSCSNALVRAKRADDPRPYQQKAREYMAFRKEQSNEYQRLA
jgi:hypothetical protein